MEEKWEARKFEYDFEKLSVYQEAVNLTEKVYEFTTDFPRDELFAITSQIRRAAMSIGLNIAEGKGRYFTKVYVQFLYQARGSLYETIALIKTSHRLKLLSVSQMEDLLQIAGRVGVQLSNLIKSLK